LDNAVSSMFAIFECCSTRLCGALDVGPLALAAALRVSMEPVSESPEGGRRTQIATKVSKSKNPMMIRSSMLKAMN